ncbi:MAG: cupin domain-containing protein [Anaerolineae bacterium]|nr:cupin domain-containing protein [Anaerolineae bacterium]
MSDGYFINSTDVTQVEMLPGVHRRTMATTDEAMICEFFLERGATVPDHSHKNDQVGYVITGRLEMTIGGQVQIVLPGNSYAVPGGIIHSARAVTDCIVLDCFSPPRDDYRTEAR